MSLEWRTTLITAADFLDIIKKVFSTSLRFSAVLSQATYAAVSLVVHIYDISDASQVTRCREWTTELDKKEINKLPSLRLSLARFFDFSRQKNISWFLAFIIWWNEMRFAMDADDDLMLHYVVDVDHVKISQMGLTFGRKFEIWH